MLDKEKLKLKVQDILRKELTDAEYLTVRIQVEKSLEDKAREEAVKEGARLAQLEISRENRKKVEEKMAAILDQLAEEAGVAALPDTEFTKSVAMHKYTKGFVSQKQLNVLTKLGNELVPTK